MHDDVGLPPIAAAIGKMFPLADGTCGYDLIWTDVARGNDEFGAFVEIRLKLLPRVFPFEIVAENAREAYGKSVPLGFHGMDMHDIRRKNRRRVLDS